MFSSTTFSKPLLTGMASRVRHYVAPGNGSVPLAKQKYVPTTGTYPKGFLASSAYVGVKASNTQFDDLALVASERPCSAAAVFTKNKFHAAPVTVSRDMLKSSQGRGVRAVVVNSGCANAVTGKGGLDDAVAMRERTEDCFEDEGDGAKSFVMSTGVIGQRLPIKKILHKIPAAYSDLGSSHNHWLRAARAICTTDTFPKLISRQFTLPSSPSTTYSITGMTKGAGMIHPNMATLLGIICTDAPIAPSALQSMLSYSIERSFNSISIDGDTSTNDTVALLANGAAGGEEVSGTSGPAYDAMQKVLQDFTADLAKLVVRDGEGATKFVTIKVSGAASYESAKRIASSVARSALVKTALYGKDANWGRILCAIGNTEGADDSIVPKETSVSFMPLDGSEEVKLLVNGEPTEADEARAAEVLQHEDLEIRIKVSNKEGEEAIIWTCDFSHEYVTINADYRT